MSTEGANPLPHPSRLEAGVIIDRLTTLYLTDRPAFADAVSQVTDLPADVLGDAAEEAAGERLAAGLSAEAEAAYQIQTMAYSQANNIPAMVDAGIRTAEVMTIRAESLPEYEFARNYALGLAGSARSMKRPLSEFKALATAAEAAYFASEQLRHDHNVVDANTWLLNTLTDCVAVLDVVEAGVGTAQFEHFLSLVLSTADRVTDRHWFDSDEAQDRTVVTEALRRIALALESFVGTEMGPEVNLDVTLWAALALARLSYSHGSPDSGYELLSWVMRRCETEGRVAALMTASDARYRGERESARPSERMLELRRDHRAVIERFRVTRRSRAGRFQAAETIDVVTGMMVEDEFAGRAQSDIDAAFDASESNRARILLDEMKRIRRNLVDARMAQAAIHLETELLHLEARDDTGAVGDEFRLLSRLPFGGLGQSAEVNEDLNRLEQLYMTHGAGFVGSAAPADLDSTIAALQPGEAILSYHIPYEPSDPAGTLLTLLVTTDGALSLHLPLLYDGELKNIGRYQADGKQPLDVSPLGNIIAMTRAAIRDGDDGTTTADLQQLYRLLIAPMADYGFVPEKFTRLIIVPYGLLHAVPFAALQDPDGHFLAEKVALVMAPSASAWTWLATQPNEPVSSLLGFADPALPPGWKPLPDSKRELETICTLVNSLKTKVRTGESASESAFRHEAPGQGILHLATHGDFPEEDALDLHRVVLSPSDNDDGLLHAEEVRHLDLSAAQLAVLSICDGGLYRFGPGDEPLGLMAAFLAAGVTNLVAPLWEIDDAATTELMIGFYSGLLTVGPAEALRQASLDLMRNGAQIRDWAGFALIGAGRPLLLADA